MNTCKSCKWWQLPREGEYWGSSDMINPSAHPDVPLPQTFEVRYCINPKIGFCERPESANQASVQDASYYQADLITAQEFGCVLHEVGTLTEKERTDALDGE